MFVWYDPLASFVSIVEKVVPRGAKLLKFEGSYLALRFKLDDEDPEFDKKWVAYTPEKATNFLKDWEFIGGKEVLSLPEVPRRVYVEVNNKKSDGITLAPGKAETIRLGWLSEFEEPPEEVEIKVVDYDTGEVMSKRKAKVGLLM